MLLVKVISLSLALTSIILGMTYIRYELSYDDHFLTGNRVYRLFNKVSGSDESQVYGISLRSAYSQLPAQIPEIESAVQFYGGWNSPVSFKEIKLDKVRQIYTDNDIFRVFGLKLNRGDQGNALLAKGNTVITGSLASKLFANEDPMGKAINSEGETFIVSGIINDLPKNTHFAFDMLISMSTLNPEQISSLEFQTYYLLKPNTNPEIAADKITRLNQNLMQNWAEATNSKVISGIEPLRQLYLNSRVETFIPVHGSKKMVIIVGLISIFVLLTALISFINLYIIQGEKRIAEITTRSMFGATKSGIAKLFLIETGIIFLLSLILSGIISYLTMPAFSSLLESKVSFSDLLQGWGIPIIIAIFLFLLLITSAYPVLYLARINYVNGLRGMISSGGRGNRLSMASVLFQFIVSSFFISCVIIILSQIHYLKNIPLGCVTDNVTLFTGFSTQAEKKYESIKSDLLNLPFIEAVSGGEHFIGGGCSGQIIRNTHESGNSNHPVNEYRMKPGIGELMKFELIDGRFIRDSKADSLSLVLNESAMQMLRLEPRSGQFVNYNDERKLVIGVVRDFIYKSNPGEPIEPLVLAPSRWWSPNIYIRSQSPLTVEQISQISTILKRHDENFIFNSVTLNEVYENMYRKETRLATMVSVGASQVVLISLISLLALTVLMLTRKTRETGIRKVLGSSVYQVIESFLKKFAILVLAGVIIASVICYFIMDQWLADYARRISLHPGYFLVSGLLILGFAGLATIIQSWYAATRNPVDALKHE